MTDSFRPQCCRSRLSIIVISRIQVALFLSPKLTQYFQLPFCLCSNNSLDKYCTVFVLGILRPFLVVQLVEVAFALVLPTVIGGRAYTEIIASPFDRQTLEYKFAALANHFVCKLARSAQLPRGQDLVNFAFLFLPAVPFPRP